MGINIDCLSKGSEKIYNEIVELREKKKNKKKSEAKA